MGNEESSITMISGKFDEKLPISYIKCKGTWDQDYVKELLMKYPELATTNEGDKLSYCIRIEVEMKDKSLIQIFKKNLDELKENSSETYEIFHIVKSEIIENKLIATIIFQDQFGKELMRSNEFFSKKLSSIFNKKMHISIKLETNIPIKKILHHNDDPLSQICEGSRIELKGSKDLDWLKTIMNEIAGSELKNQDFANSFGPIFDFLDRLDYIYGKVELSDEFPILKEFSNKQSSKEVKIICEVITELVTKMKIKTACKSIGKINVIFPLHPILVLELEIDILDLIDTITSYIDSK